MTPLLLSLLGLLAIYSLYIAARVARLGGPPGAFCDAGQAVPGWAVMFLLPGLAAAGLGIERHGLLVGRYGLQASHVAMGIVLVSVAALMIWNRLWLVTRLAGLTTPGEALGRYYDSIALRVIMMGLALLFALPFAANLLSSAALLLETATHGLIPRGAGVWLLAFALAVPAIVGGWRGTVLALAMQAVLLAVLLPGVTVLAELTAPGPGYPDIAIAVADGVLWDRIPGVLQNAAGLGKSVPPGGIFTTVGIGSSAVALLGMVLSPAALYLGQTARPGPALGVSAVWLTGGALAGVFIVGMPVLAGRMPDDWAALADMLFDEEPLAGAAVYLLVLVGSLLAVAFLITGGAILITRDVIHTWLLPDLSGPGLRLSVRIALGFGFFLAALMAGFAPYLSAVAASVALPLSVQMLPALLGLTYLRWISQGAVLAGLTLGGLIVVFTEPLGLILFEALFVDLPWGRWPLTIHSAVWGLVFNLALVLLASAVTWRAPGWLRRDRLHRAMTAHLPDVPGGRGLLWSLTLLWGFLAYGPGAILGNTFFSKPIFSKVEATLGLPSLWVWQILFWLLGVVLLWWLAYRMGLGRTCDEGLKPVDLGGAHTVRAPDWLAAGLARVADRPYRAGRRRDRRSVDLSAPSRDDQRRTF